jgi:hypothetical protein
MASRLLQVLVSRAFHPMLSLSTLMRLKFQIVDVDLVASNQRESYRRDLSGLFQRREVPIDRLQKQTSCSNGRCSTFEESDTGP